MLRAKKVRTPASHNPRLTLQSEYSVLLLGLDNAGKTTLLSSIKSIYLPDHPTPATRTVPTVGQNVSTITLADMYLKVWDVGGQHSLRKLWQSYYKSCHAIIFVIDSSDIGDTDLGFLEAQRERKKPGTTISLDGETSREHLGRLEECKLVLESVLASSDTIGVPILVLANKQDREDCVETVKIKEGLVRPVFEGDRGSGIRDSRVLPISALTGTGVSDALEWVRTRVRFNKEGRPPRMR